MTSSPPKVIGQGLEKYIHTLIEVGEDETREVIRDNVNEIMKLHRLKSVVSSK